jgi:hypothetical protein
LSIYAKETALELILHYTWKKPMFVVTMVGFEMFGIALVVGIVLLCVALTSDADGMIIAGPVCLAVGILGLASAGWCWWCSCQERRRLENELTDPSRGRLVGQTLVKEDF